MDAGDVVPRGGCGSRVGGADDHHDRGLLSLDKGVVGVSEVQLPPPPLLEALDEGDRGRGVLDGHVALGAAVALRWERRIRRHRAAAHVRPRQHEAGIVDQAPDDGHGTGRWGARAARGVHRHESRDPSVGALDTNARLLPRIRVVVGRRMNRPHADERLVGLGVGVWVWKPVPGLGLTEIASSLGWAGVRGV